jgi:hypothetical protein
MSDGGFLLGGGSSSGANGNKTSANFGGVDFWTVRLDANGNKLWDASFGGANDDAFYNLSTVATSDGGFLLAGDSQSGATGNKTTANFGGADFWVVKLGGATGPTLMALPQQNVIQNGFQFVLSGQSNQFYVVEKSATLLPQSWTPISTNQLLGTQMTLTDLGARTQPKGFYRARQGP